jgi:hypothetical protein
MKLAILMAGLVLLVATPERASAQGSAVGATDSVNARVRAKSKKKVAASATKSDVAPDAFAATVKAARKPAVDSAQAAAAARRKAPPVPKRSSPAKKPG